MSDSGKAVFLSYASQDAEAAKRIADALRAAGVEVWFDQNELVGGDSWDAKIRKQIAECALFVPIISANTQARLEGYFRREWKQAANRTHDMADEKAFLLPVVIDSTRDPEAKVPPEFKAVQWTRLPAGETAPAFVVRVKRLLDADSYAAVQTQPEAAAPTVTSRPAARSSKWLAPVAGAMVAAIVALLVWRPWERTASTSPEKNFRPTKTETESGPVSEARKLVNQARQVYEGGDEISRENLLFAEDLVKRALVLDPSDAEGWILASRLSWAMLWYSLDASEARREQLLQQASRARALAPNSVSAQLATINARLAINLGRTAVPADFEQEVRTLVARDPGNWRVQQAWGTLLRFIPGRQEESLAAIRRAVELSNGSSDAIADWVNTLVRQGKFAEAYEVLSRDLPEHPTARMLCWDVIVRLRWKGGPAAAQKSLTRFPAWLLQEDRGLHLAWQTWYWSREPLNALRAAQAAQRDYVRDFSFYGPRAALTALAHEQAGNTEAAQADWQSALARTERELAADPQAEDALYWKAWSLCRLGRLSEARRITAQLRQRNKSSTTAFFKNISFAALLATTGEFDEALAEISVRLKTLDDSVALTRPALEMDPAFDQLRIDPRFQALLREAPAPVANATVDAAMKVDEKSVAVLAFANLSDDKANEYFSDGISEELLNVLAKIPGLKVSARTSAFFFKGKETPIPEIARQLGVAYVVEGSVRKAGDKVRITAQLIKAADGFHVWSDTFTRDLKDIFAVQDEIAGLIAQNLEMRMGIVAARPTVDLEAYQEFLAGRSFVSKASHEDLREAVRHFEKAVAIDPNFAPAWVQLASVHTQLGRWGGAPTLRSWAAARAAIDRALALAPDSPDALVALGWIRRTAEWNWKGAESAFRRALQLRPDHADTLAGAAVLLFNLGQEEEAFRLGARAAQLDPLNPATQIDLSLMYYLSENFVEGERTARRALQLAPQGAGYRAILAWSLIEQHRFEEAEREARLDADEIQQALALGILAIARGQPGEARAQIARLEKLAEPDGDRADLQQNIAWIAAGLGEADRAFAALRRAQVSRDPSVAWLRNSPYLRNLFADQRWKELLRHAGLSDEQLR